MVHVEVRLPFALRALTPVLFISIQVYQSIVSNRALLCPQNFEPALLVFLHWYGRAAYVKLRSLATTNDVSIKIYVDFGCSAKNLILRL